jgi:hypothetical protein
MVFGGLALAMCSNVFVCQIHLCLRLVVPRAASRDQHAAVKWCATNPQLELESVERLDVDSKDRKPLLLSLMVGVSASVFRAGQTKGEDFVVSGSADFLVARSPIEGAVYD